MVVATLTAVLSATLDHLEFRFKQLDIWFNTQIISDIHRRVEGLRAEKLINSDVLDFVQSAERTYHKYFYQ